LSHLHLSSCSSITMVRCLDGIGRALSSTEIGVRFNEQADVVGEAEVLVQDMRTSGRMRSPYGPMAPLLEAARLKLQSGASWFSRIRGTGVEEAIILLQAAELAAARDESESSTLMTTLLSDDGTVRRTASNNSKRWLLRTFTECDPDVAEGNDALKSVPIISPIPSRTSNTRRSYVETSERLKLAHKEPQLCVLSTIGQLNFDVLEFSDLPDVAGRPLSIVGPLLVKNSHAAHQLELQGRIPNAEIFQKRLFHYFGEVEDTYKTDVPFHASPHAADVMVTVEWFFRSQFFRENMSKLDHVMGLIAAAVHDAGHPGKNNLFLAKTMDPLAIMYNDKSILENMHLALAFELMFSNEEADWFSLLPRNSHALAGEDSDTSGANLQQYVRKGLISMVLATDMAKHAKCVTSLNRLVMSGLDGQPAKYSQKQEALDRKFLMLDVALHAADISNPTKPRPAMLAWTQRLVTEFWAQGDEETNLGLELSPLCDRAAGQMAVPKNQLGFINFIIQPLFAPIAKLIPEAEEATEYLTENKAFWQEMDKKTGSTSGDL